MPDRNTEPVSKRRSLNMMAVQIAGEFPGNRRDAEYVLARIRKILEENVYDDEVEASDSSSDGRVVRFTVV